MFRPQSQTRFWLLALVAFALALWLLKPVLLPFVAGMIIAYFLNPVVNILWRHKIPRWLGTFIVLLAFAIGVALIVTLIFPLLQSQIGALIDAIPGYIGKIRAHYMPWMESWLARFAPEDVEKLRGAAGESVTQAAGWAAKLVQQIVSGGFALIDILALSIIMPIVAFYMLRDWPRLVGVIDTLLPRRHYQAIQEQLNEIDNTLSGFIRGQALVCLALGLIYSIGLTLVGLDYGAAIGITAGVLSFIPYVGTIFGWVTSVLLAFVQFDDWTHIGMVAGVFIIGNILESYILTPRLVGSRVGLHPVWILFALLAGAKLMGFTGVLIAVPTAAILGVLTRFAMSQYKSSSFYKDPLAPTKP
ncbi:MAG: AI-2E family transporter [Alphaproteobacteria bacterium]|nr:AI-2E family transporter [Alphaproteobacteria bacterium]